jgi:hypothetical protein
MNYYRLFGMTLASEIEFANLLISAPTTEPDYILKLGNIDDSNLAAPRLGIYTHATGSELYHKIPDIVSFHCNNRLITVEKNNNSDSQDIKAFLLDTIFTYLLNQHGYLVLRGSAIKIGTNALLIASNSSNGTSALAATLHEEFGYSIISDGLLVIKSSPEAKNTQLIPSNTPLMLWQDSCKHLALSYEQQLQVRLNLLKYEFPQALTIKETLPIKNLIHLATHNATTIDFQTLTTTDKIDELLELTHYPQLMKASNNTRNSFKLAVQLANNCNILKITRPTKYNYQQFAHEVHVKLLENSLIRIGKNNE